MNVSGHRARICLITPGHLATNPRLVKEADALTEAGNDVAVIAADYVGWAREADAEFRGRPWQVAARLSFGPDAPPARYLVQTLRRRGARALLRLAPRSSLLQEAATHPIGPDLIRAARAVRADLYIAHYIAALPAAAKAAARFGAKYAFDAEDFHLGEFPDGQATLARDLVAAIEARYLPGCAYLTAASPGIADAYAENYGLTRPTVVLNVFPKDRAPPQPTEAGTIAPGPSVYWFSQTIGPNRGLETAVRALSLSAARPHLYLRGNPARGFAEELLAIAAAGGSTDRIHFLAPAPPGEMERVAQNYDIGLASEPGWTRNNSILLSNKIFTYLLAGLPIAASATSANTSLAATGVAAIHLYEPDNPVALASVYDALLLDKACLTEARISAWRLGQQRFNWELENRVLLSEIERTLA